MHQIQAIEEDGLHTLSRNARKAPLQAFCPGHERISHQVQHARNLSILRWQEQGEVAVASIDSSSPEEFQVIRHEYSNRTVHKMRRKHSCGSRGSGAGPMLGGLGTSEARYAGNS